MELVNISSTVQSNWKELNLGDSAILKARIGWQGLTTAEYLDTGSYYLITGTDFKNGFIDWDNCVFVEKNRYDQDRNIQVQVGDVLVTKDGTIGKVAFVDKVPKPTTLNSGVFVIRPKNRAFDTKYFYYVLMSNHFAGFLSRLTAGSTISHLYQKDFVHFNFPLPPLTEQKAIAQVLSDTDNLIQAIELKLTKKRAIKQGAMQQLLSPKQDWAVKRLGEETELITKGTTPTSIGKEFTTTGINFVKVESLKANGVFKPNMFAHIDLETHSILKRSQIKENDLLISIAGALGRSGIVTKEILPANTNQALAIVRLKSNSKIDLKFLFHYLRTEDIKIHIEATSSQGAQPNLSLLDISELPIPIPKTKEEQTGIATILSDMDAEIAQLEQKLSKYKMVKQGLMQNLLTGKIRLV